MAELALPRRALPARTIPTHWPTIGSMEDLTAASYEDVIDFFKKWYGPANASVVIAGDVDTARGPRRWPRSGSATSRKSAPVEPLAPRPVVLREEKRLLLEDQVELPRLYLAWPTPPRLRARRRGARRPWPASWPTARTRGSTSGSSTSCRWRRT